MHRIDALGHVANMFDPGDPLVPRRPTKLDHTIMNALQEEIAKTIEGAGLALRASGGADEAAGYASQLLQAIDRLSPVKAACVLNSNGGAPALVGTARNVSGVSFQAAGGGAPKRFRVTFASPIATPIAVAVTYRRNTALGSDNVTVWPILWTVTTTYVEFYAHAAVFTVGPGWEFSAFTIESLAGLYDVVVTGA
jgi:hypothetical protein